MQKIADTLQLPSGAKVDSMDGYRDQDGRFHFDFTGLKGKSDQGGVDISSGSVSQNPDGTWDVATDETSATASSPNGTDVTTTIPGITLTGLDPKNMSPDQLLDYVRPILESNKESIYMLIASSKNLTPHQKALIRNEMIDNRNKAIRETANKLREDGKNLQAFLLENKDKLLASGMGLAAGSVGYMGSYAALGMMPFFKKRKLLRFLLAAGAGTGAGIGAGLLTHKFLTRHYTPSNKATDAQVYATFGSMLQDLGDSDYFKHK